MTEEKRNRIIGAFTVTVILLIAILTAILIYQLVVIVSINKQKKYIEGEIYRYTELTKESKDKLEYLESEEHLWEELIANDYHKR
ncbi:MAG: hypothetical protein J1F61_04360 [Clostridiales bacterium]|nr:hypothetical protein [Clostridiales bacterium]